MVTIRIAGTAGIAATRRVLRLPRFFCSYSNHLTKLRYNLYVNWLSADRGLVRSTYIFLCELLLKFFKKGLRFDRFLHVFVDG